MTDRDSRDCQLDHEDCDLNRSQDETRDVQFYIGLSAETPDFDSHQDNTTCWPGVSDSETPVTGTMTTSGVSISKSMPLLTPYFQTLLDKYNSLNRQSISTLHSRPSQITFDSPSVDDRMLSTLAPPRGVYCINQPVATRGDTYWNFEVSKYSRDSIIESDESEIINDKVSSLNVIIAIYYVFFNERPTLLHIKVTSKPY